MPSLERLEDALEVRLQFGEKHSVEEAAKLAVELSLERLGAQSCSVFLLDGRGVLRRTTIGGRDANGNSITDDWYSDESYEPGEGFTGTAIVPKERGDRFGRPAWSLELEHEPLKERSRLRYRELLGELSSGIAVPLNGLHRTFGVLEVLNTPGHGTPGAPSSFTIEDVYWLSIIGNQLANSLSHLQRLAEIETLAMLGELLVELVAAQDLSEVPSVEPFAEKLVADRMLYSAAVIWERDSDGRWMRVGRAGDVDWSDWDDDPSIPERTVNQRVVDRAEPVIIQDTTDSIDDFANREWVTRNALRSYGCFPLHVGKDIVGTLSVYKYAPHDFMSHDLTLMRSVASVLAAYVRIHRIMLARASSLAGSRRVLTDIDEDTAHQIKNIFINVQRRLRAAIAAGGRRGLRMVAEEIDALDERIERLRGEIADAPVVAVNLNDLLQELVREVRSAVVEPGITFEVHMDRDLPLLLMRDYDVRDAFRNVLQNAAKAITATERGYGRIEVVLRRLTDDFVELVEVDVTDDGVGIAHEDFDSVFERGTTSYPGGTGIGLWSARRVLDNYGGRVSIAKSTVGSGTTVSIQIPIKRNLA